jgi:glycosyltransferase involved in cell wall biosynthesis
MRVNRSVPTSRFGRGNWRGGRLCSNRHGMLSVLIETRNDEENLPGTLASLISGLVEGAVREVIVCDRGSTDGTGSVAEHAGCTFLADGGITAGVRRAKSEWLLLIEPGARLVDGWTEAVLAHAMRHKMPARFSRSRSGRASFLSRVFSGNRGLAEGLLISKSQALALSRSGGDAEAVARGLATRRLTSEIRVAAPRR